MQIQNRVKSKLFRNLLYDVIYLLYINSEWSLFFFYIKRKEEFKQTILHDATKLKQSDYRT